MLGIGGEPAAADWASRLRNAKEDAIRENSVPGGWHTSVPSGAVTNFLGIVQGQNPDTIWNPVSDVGLPSSCDD